MQIALRDVLRLIYLRIIGFDRPLLTILLLIFQTAVHGNSVVTNVASFDFIRSLLMKPVRVWQIMRDQLLRCFILLRVR